MELTMDPINLKKAARIAGALYLANIITGIFSEMVVRGGTIVWSDAAATARNIAASGWLFRAGIVSDLLMTSLFLLMGLAFYRLFRPVSKTVARTMLGFNFVGVPIMALNLLNMFAPVILLSGADYLKVFSIDQLNGLALFFLSMHKFGYIIAAISYSTYLFPLGYLVFRSGFLPKPLGILVMVGSLGGLIDLVVRFVFPAMADPVSPFVTIPWVLAEFSLCLWLLIVGARLPKGKVASQPITN